MTAQTQIKHLQQDQPDAIDVLLALNPHPLAQELAEFHQLNPTFLPAVAAELGWLKQVGRKRAGINSIVEFLRWDQPWKKNGGYAVKNALTALMARVVMLFYPDTNGMLEVRSSVADGILPIVICRGKVQPRNDGDFRLDNGFRIMRAGNTWAKPPVVSAIDRVPTLHALISFDEAAKDIAPLRAIVERAANPYDPLLIAWKEHFTTQPEMFSLMQQKLRGRNPSIFSGKSIEEYVRWSIRRAAEQKRPFTLSSRFSSLYHRALVLVNPEFNGRCSFVHCRVDGLLGLKLAEKQMNNEPYRRLEAK